MSRFGFGWELSGLIFKLLEPSVIVAAKVMGKTNNRAATAATLISLMPIRILYNIKRAVYESLTDYNTMEAQLIQDIKNE